MARLHRLCEFCAVVWRLEFSVVISLPPTFCSACEVTCVICRHLNAVVAYLITHLLIIIVIIYLLQ